MPRSIAIQPKTKPRLFFKSYFSSKKTDRILEEGDLQFRLQSLSSKILRSWATISYKKVGKLTQESRRCITSNSSRSQYVRHSLSQYHTNTLRPPLDNAVSRGFRAYPWKEKNVTPLPRQIPEHTLSLPEAPLSSTPSRTAIVSLGEHFILYSLKYGSLVIVFSNLNA